MNCVRCGREIPDGQLFCATCRLPSVAKPAEPLSVPKPPRQASTAEKEKKPFPWKQFSLWILTVFLVSTAVLSVACIFFFRQYRTYLTEKDALETAQREMKIREATANEKDSTIWALKSEVIAKETQIEAKDAEIQQLTDALTEAKETLDELESKLRLAEN